MRPNIGPKSQKRFKPWGGLNSLLSFFKCICAQSNHLFSSCAHGQCVPIYGYPYGGLNLFCEFLPSKMTETRIYVAFNHGGLLALFFALTISFLETHRCETSRQRAAFCVDFIQYLMWTSLKITDVFHAFRGIAELESWN